MKMVISCDCGSVKGAIDSTNLKGYRAVCLCDDCQAFAHFIQRPDTLDVNGGTDIIPVMPSHYTIQEGLENLKCLRLSDKGMFRWYTSCCKTPFGNLMSPGMPYIGTPLRLLEKNYSKEQIEGEFGPVRERMQAQYAIGPLPPLAQKKVSMSFLLRVLKFIVTAKLTKSGSPSPFFNSDGKPACEPYVLSSQERDTLRPLCGSKRVF